MKTVNLRFLISIRLLSLFRNFLILMAVSIIASAAFVACGDNGDDPEGGGSSGGGKGKVWVDIEGGKKNVAYSDLNEAINSIKKAGKYTVRVGENQKLSFMLIISKSGVDVTIKADNKPVEITMNSMFPMDDYIFITVLDGASLTLDKGITLKGMGKNERSTAVVANESELIINEGATITNFGNNYQKDTNPGMEAVIVVGLKNTKFIMNGGAIRKNFKRALSVNNYADFIMNGGIISENITIETHGGAGVVVYNWAIFTMNGGEISGNEAINDYIQGGGEGGGVSLANGSVGATFNMKGGTIANNIAEKGGGVYVYDSNNEGAKFNLEGGTITGNEADTGGGVYVDGFNNVSDHYSGIFNMKGGTIEKNTAGAGGGVFYEGKFTMTGGLIAANTASSSGGGVAGGPFQNSFTKKGGIITGYGDTNANKVIISGVLPNNRSVGHAVTTGYMKVREFTANEKTDLDSGISGNAGGWDNAFEPK